MHVSRKKPDVNELEKKDRSDEKNRNGSRTGLKFRLQNSRLFSLKTVKIA